MHKPMRNRAAMEAFGKDNHNHDSEGRPLQDMQTISHGIQGSIDETSFPEGPGRNEDCSLNALVCVQALSIETRFARENR